MPGYKFSTKRQKLVPGYVPIKRDYSARYAAKTKYGRKFASPKETGYHDVGSTTYDMSTSGSILHLNVVPQGTTVISRVGKKYMLKSIQFRGRSIAGSATTVADGAYMIVYDKRPTGSLPSITDILVSVNSESFNNDSNSPRFQILKRVDRIFTGNSSTITTDGCAHTEDFFLKLRNLPVVCKFGTAGTIGEISDGALYMVSVGNVAAGTSAPSISGQFRIRFLDV